METWLHSVPYEQVQVYCSSDWITAYRTSQKNVFSVHNIDCVTHVCGIKSEEEENVNAVVARGKRQTWEANFVKIAWGVIN